jgi:hypothetical protein
MARFSIRKLGSRGDTCTAVTEAELEEHLRQELGQGYSAAVRANDGTSAFVGKDVGQVMGAVEKAAANTEEVEVLLIPPVAGGQLSPPLLAIKKAADRTQTLHLTFVPEDLDCEMPEGIGLKEIYQRILGMFSITEDETFPPDFSFDDLMEVIDDFLKSGRTLKIYIHDFFVQPSKIVNFDRLMEKGSKISEVPFYRCAYIGALSAGTDRSYVLNSKIKFDDDEVLGRWLRACVDFMWVRPAFTQTSAEKLAEAVVEYMRGARLRSLETLRLALGNEAAERLLSEGHITVKSSNGREYLIDTTGEVFDASSGDYVCVEVRNEEWLPRYDVVLAKYLVIRDHPEQISTLGESPESERQRLLRQIEIYEEGLSEFKGRLAVLDGQRGEGRAADGG